MIIETEVAPGVWYKLNEWSKRDFETTEKPRWEDSPVPLRIVHRNPEPKKTPWRAPLVVLEKRM